MTYERPSSFKFDGRSGWPPIMYNREVWNGRQHLVVLRGSDSNVSMLRLRNWFVT